MNSLDHIWQLLAGGGIYMYPIFALSVVMFSLIVRHIYRYRSLIIELRCLNRRFECDIADNSSLPVLLNQYHFSRCSDIELNNCLRNAMVSNFFSREGADGRSVILCGSIVMLMGLLGTVSGMINTFEAIQLFGVGNTKSFAAGIAEALLTTQSGLLVGVAGMIAGHTIRRLYKKMRIKLYRHFDALENYPHIYYGAPDNG